MASDGTLIFDTKIDTSGFEKGLKGLKLSGVKAASSIAGEITKGIIGASALQGGIKTLVDFGKKSIKLASDLQEVQNVVDVTFGQGAADVNNFAKEASTAFGLTELQAKQFTGTLGAMLKSMGLSETEAKDMAISMAGLVGDMASFYNLDHETAFEKIRSGLAGETEPLRQLGINMSVANLEAYRLSKGIKTAYDSMTEAEKTQLRYSYLMEQTSDAQGDFSRTQDSFANQVRLLSNNIDTLAANIGSKLLPFATSAVSALNNLFSGGFGGNAEESPIVKELNSAIESLEALDYAVEQAKQDFARNVIKINADYSDAQGLIDTLDLLQKQRGEDGNIDLGTVNLSLGDAGTEVENLQTALKDLGYLITDENGVFGESTAAAVEQFQTTAGLAADAIVGQQTKAAINAALISGSTEQLKEVTDQLVELYPELEQYVGEDGVLSLEADKVRELTEAYKDLAIQKAFQSKIEELGGAYTEGYVNVEITKQTVKDAQEQASAIEEQQKALESLKEQLQETATAVANFQELGQYSTVSDFFGAEVEGGVDKTVESLQKYFEIIGGITPEMFDNFSKLGINLSELVGADGKLLDASEIEGNEKALQELMELAHNVGAEQLQAQIDAKQAELEAINSGIEEAKAQIDEAQSNLDGILQEIEATKQAQESFMAEIESNAEESGETVGKTIGDKTASGIKDSKGKAESEFSVILQGLQSKASSTKIRIPVSYSVPSLPGISGGSPTKHATGLYRVPYDNYYAQLHAGERVLTAAEAREYNRSESASTRMPQEPIVIEQPPQTIVVEIGGNRFAEAQVESNRIALNNLSKKIAQGRGSR